MKKCTKCQQYKSLDAFRAQPTGRNGLYASCRTCESDYAKARLKGPKQEQIREYHRARTAEYRKNNPAAVREAKRKYYASDKGKECKRREDEAYRTSGGRRASDLRRAQQPLSDARLEARLRYQHKKRALMKSMGELDNFVLAEAIHLMRLRSNTLGSGWHVDHIVPVSKGGKTTHDNLQVVPALWNRQKSNKHQQRFFAA